jgi:hypothetical protein
MNCAQCGAENMQGSEKCWKCGATLRVHSEPRPRSSWILWSSLGVVVLLGILMLFAAGGGGGAGAGGSSGASVLSSQTATATTRPAPPMPPASPARAK